MPDEEIAYHEQLLLLQQWFQKSSASEASESICMWERVNDRCLIDYCLRFCNICVGKNGFVVEDEFHFLLVCPVPMNFGFLYFKKSGQIHTQLQGCFMT